MQTAIATSSNTSIIDRFNPANDRGEDKVPADPEWFDELQSFAEAYVDQFELMDGTLPFVYDPVHPEVDFQTVFVAAPGEVVSADVKGVLTITLRAGEGTAASPYEEVVLRLDETADMDGSPILTAATGYRASEVIWNLGNNKHHVSEEYIKALKSIVYKNASSLEIVMDDSLPTPVSPLANLSNIFYRPFQK